MDMQSVFICAAIHSAVRVSTGEADEIAAQSLCGFCGKITVQRPKRLIERENLFLCLAFPEGAGDGDGLIARGVDARVVHGR